MAKRGRPSKSKEDCKKAIDKAIHDLPNIEDVPSTPKELSIEVRINSALSDHTIEFKGDWKGKHIKMLQRIILIGYQKHKRVLRNASRAKKKIGV